MVISLTTVHILFGISFKNDINITNKFALLSTLRLLLVNLKNMFIYLLVMYTTMYRIFFKLRYIISRDEINKRNQHYKSLSKH